MSIEPKSKLMLFPKIGKFIIIFFALAFIVVGVRAYQLYQYIFEENVKSDYILLIKDGFNFEQVTDSLLANNVLLNYKAFNWVSKKKKYPDNVKPGRYIFQKGKNYK